MDDDLSWTSNSNTFSLHLNQHSRYVYTTTQQTFNGQYSRRSIVIITIITIIIILVVSTEDRS